MATDLRTVRRASGPAPDDATERQGRGGSSPARLVVPFAFALALVAGVALRFLSTSELWLDEALSVNIAREGVSGLFAALRHDGHPPLYYLLLFGWTELFGTSDIAVRALSGVVSCASLPVTFLVARRLRGPQVGWAAVLLLASSPFATRYATETRMYSLVVLLTLLGMLAVLRVLEGGRIPDLAFLAGASGALVLTHYWGFFLVATSGALLTGLAVRGYRRRQALLAVAALAAGLLLFLPWLPTFLFQLASTGTPWAVPGQPSAVAAAIAAFAGDVDNVGVGLLLVFALLTGLALFARRATSGHSVELDFRTMRGGRELSIVVFGTLALGIGVGLVTGSGYASRYASVVLAPYLVLVSLGVAALPSTILRHGLLAAAAVFGLLGSAENVVEQRTQAVEVSALIQERGRPGDLVVYCPDQLGPAHDRLLGDEFGGMVFPTGGEPGRVDWVDYEDRNLQAGVFGVAQEAVLRAGPRDIWLVSAPDYLTFGTKCEQLGDALQRLRVFERPVTTIPEDPALLPAFYERSMLTHYPATLERPFAPGVVE